MNRREFGLAIAAAMAAPVVRAQPGGVSVRDILGRTVTLKQPARRVLLVHGRQLAVLGLIHPDPVGLLVGIGGDFQRQDGRSHDAYLSAFPALAGVPRIGLGNPDGFPMEAAIAARPDLIVCGRPFAGGMSGNASSHVLQQIEAAGIPVLVADFHTSPLKDTVPSLRALGTALGRENAAEALIAFYQERIDRIASRLSGASIARPRVLMHVHAGGTDCCFSPGRGTLNDMIALAGGTNVGADLLPGASGQLNLEQVLSSRADFYVATGGPHLASRGGFVVGTGVPEEQAAATFAALLKRPEVASIPAVAGGRVLGLWHGFVDTPLHLVAIEAMARTLHPGLFADIDPLKTLAAVNDGFAALKLAGTFLVDKP